MRRQPFAAVVRSRSGTLVAAVVVGCLAFGSRASVAPRWPGASAASGASALAAGAASPVAVDPRACRVAPRPLADFVALAEATPGLLRSQLNGSPIATPPMPAGGAPADPTIVAAVTATVVESAACLNAGDLPRYLALFTDEAFFRAYGGGGAGDEDFERQLATLATPQPLPAAQQVRSPTVDDVRVLPDGRVTAIVRSNFGESLVVFAESDGQYRFDWSYRPDGTPTP
jgi:hypothetical protein